MKVAALFPLFFLFFMACQSISEFKEAERNFSFGNYGAALQNINIALRKDPDNKYYKVFQKIVKERLSEEYYQESLKLLEKGQLTEAQRILEKILKDNLNPLHLGASRKLAQINKTKDSIKQILQKAKEDMNSGNWDEAYKALSEILVYDDEFTPVLSFYEKSKTGSFQMHFQKGQQAFYQQDYILAKERFETALSRIPTSKECLEWQNKSVVYQNALDYAQKAEKFLEEKQYFSGIQEYENALKLVPSFPGMQSKWQKAVNLWMQESLEKSEKYLLDARKNPKLAFKSLKELEKIKKYSQIYKNSDALFRKSQTICAEYLFQEARNFLWQNDFAKVGIACFFLQLASELDDSLPGLEPLLAQCKKLVALKYHRYFVFFPKEEDVIQQIAWQISQNFIGHSFSCYSFTQDPMEKIKDRVYQDAFTILKETGLNAKNFPLCLYRIHLHLEKWEIHREENKEEVLSSEYFAGLKEEIDPFWETYQKALLEAKNTLQRLFPLYSKALEEYEINFMELQKNEQEKKAAERILNQYHGLKNRMGDWKNALQEYKIRTWELAKELEQSADTQIMRLDKEALSALEKYKKSYALSESLSQKARTMEKQIKSLEKDMEKYQKYIDFYTKVRKEEQKISYNFHQNQVGLKGKSKLFLSIGKETGENIGDFSHEANLAFSLTRRKNVHPWDTKDYYNIKIFFAPDDVIKKENIQRLAQGMYSRLLVFLQEYPLILFREAGNVKSTQNMEKLAEFLELAGTNYPVECEAARKILKEFAGWEENDKQ